MLKMTARSGLAVRPVVCSTQRSNKHRHVLRRVAPRAANPAPLGTPAKQPSSRPEVEPVTNSVGRSSREDKLGTAVFSSCSLDGNADVVDTRNLSKDGGPRSGARAPPKKAGGAEGAPAPRKSKPVRYDASISAEAE